MFSCLGNVRFGQINLEESVLREMYGNQNDNLVSAKQFLKNNDHVCCNLIMYNYMILINMINGSHYDDGSIS